MDTPMRQTKPHLSCIITYAGDVTAEAAAASENQVVRLVPPGNTEQVIDCSESYRLGQCSLSVFTAQAEPLLVGFANFNAKVIGVRWVAAEFETKKNKSK